ncbi:MULTISPECIES: hypothetical protein [Streptomyces]|uniref:GerMN domain-containing protein n=1 Tax=Streptomyces chartreusis NRRL 3882 TaxID=1079985 RepID=A0A2N9BA20_STRCX|nr:MULTISPECIES: hypothetical protein [Streptomyces]MYS91096.1 hypothetical protein [Streptomyces sp. SID5464]SOR80185.1 hypothetical protein SCNRRL3882_3641 [Streptomyces chartreusis NRRL 3882]
MKAVRALALLTSLFALSSCGIPTTGVVEAGGPASGIPPITRVYFVHGDTVVAVPRSIAYPSDPGAALRLLMLGPTSAEARKGLTTEVPGLPTSAPLPPPTAGEWRDLSSDAPAVTVNGDTLSVELPSGIGALRRLATRQLICTAAAAHHLGKPSAGPVTVRVASDSGWHAMGSDEDCPVP